MNTLRKVITVNSVVDYRLAAEEENTPEGNVSTENQVKVSVRIGILPIAQSKTQYLSHSLHNTCV